MPPKTLQFTPSPKDLMKGQTYSFAPMKQSTPLFIPIEEAQSPVTSPLQRASGQIKGIAEGVNRFMKPRLENLSNQFSDKNIIDTAMNFSPMGTVGAGGNYAKEFAQQEGKKIFGGLKNLSTKLLERFKGMPEEITEQQFNEVVNRTRKEGVKKADEETLMSSLVKENGKINLTKTSQNVEKQLVTLTPTPVKSPRWSNVGADYIGDGNYGEVVYQSPIKTSAGSIHYFPRTAGGGRGASEFPNYFSHVRFEDLSDGKTRKILETQSDLMQKENFAREYDVRSDASEISEMKRLEGVDKLEKYQSNDPLAQLRTFREEVKRAAKDGKDTILIPSGDTAMKIEGLGKTSDWFSKNSKLTPDKMKVGQIIYEGRSPSSNWIITDVLGDGKFKAVPKDRVEQFGMDVDNMPTGTEETFDISGKIDSKHFVYKLNEEAIPKEARKLGLQVEKLDDIHPIEKGYRLNESRTNYEPSTAKGSWWKITIPKEMKKAPVQAFSFAPLFIPHKDKEASTNENKAVVQAPMIGTNYDPYDRAQNRTDATEDNLGEGTVPGFKIDGTMVATSKKRDNVTGNLKLGTVIFVKSLNRPFLVADVMNKRFNGMNKIDFANPRSGSTPIPKYNKTFAQDDIEIVREGKGREDVRNFVNSGEWMNMQREYKTNLLKMK